MKPIKTALLILLLGAILLISACGKEKDGMTDKNESESVISEDTTERAKIEKVPEVDPDLPAEYLFPAQLPDSVAGKVVFAQNCEGCHGAKGDQIKEADFSSREFFSDERPFELFEVITNGKDGMPAWKSKLSEADRWNALYYVWSMRLKAEEVEAGVIEYGTYCASCHGASGTGQGSEAVSQNLKPRSFTDLQWMNGQTNAFLFKWIKNGTGSMPSFAEDLTDDQILTVIDFVRSFSYGPKRETEH